jgi:hypothetical protein
MEKLINAKIKELTENGKLDEIVTKQATDFITAIMRDSLREYSDVGKAFKAKLESQLLDGFNKFDFIQYSKTITDLVESELNKSVLSMAIEPVKDMIKNFTGELEKKNWKLSEIIEKFKELEITDYKDDDSGEISFIHELSDYGTNYIAFDEHPNINHKFQCKYRLMVDQKTKQLYSPSVDGIPTHPVSEIGGLFGFNLFLFKLYAMKCEIECDYNDVEVEWSTYND